jgi:hypothetical protein
LIQDRRRDQVTKIINFFEANIFLSLCISFECCVTEIGDIFDYMGKYMYTPLEVVGGLLKKERVKLTQLWPLEAGKPLPSGGQATTQEFFEDHDYAPFAGVSDIEWFPMQSFQERKYPQTTHPSVCPRLRS